MKRTSAMTFLAFCAVLSLLVLATPHQAVAQATVNVTTWHQDIPAVCTGCVYRTGQNLQEATIRYNSNILDTSFGQYCYYDQLDGQVYGQPLVVTNVKINGVTYPVVVYVVTMNGTVYAFDGQPPVPTSWPTGKCSYGANHTVGPIVSQSVLGGAIAAGCAHLGADGCMTIAPNVGILGTPVISTGTNNGTTIGTIYLVAESQSGAPITWKHTLWALDITTLSLTTAISVPIGPLASGCYGGSSASTFSHLHIQRPALLLGGDNYLYIAFSMMDGNPTPLPNGMMLAFNTVGLNHLSQPLCFPMSEGAQSFDGAGIWGGGGGPDYGPDANTSTTGKNYTFFNTANGVYDGSTNWGDSFIKMYNTGSALQVTVSNSFTPGDQRFRSDATCGGTGDTDFGSGNPMLLPDNENSSYPYLAVSGDKEGGIWFMDRTSPGGYGGDPTCTVGSDNNLQTYPINGIPRQTAAGPVIHTNPAYWENSEALQNATSYIFIGSSQFDSSASGRGQLLRYQICDSGLPINSSPCSVTGAAASDSSGVILFPWGTTPSVSAASTSETDAIVWAIWADGSVVPSLDGFTWGQETFPAAKHGVLYAFDAASSTSNMPKLYSSKDCTIGGQLVDQINPATKYSVPTVADGHVYLGTQGDLVPRTSCSDPTATCFNTGTFYVFGPVSRSSCGQ